MNYPVYYTVIYYIHILFRLAGVTTTGRRKNPASPAYARFIARRPTATHPPTNSHTRVIPLHLYGYVYYASAATRGNRFGVYFYSSRAARLPYYYYYHCHYTSKIRFRGAAHIIIIIPTRFRRAHRCR